VLTIRRASSDDLETLLDLRAALFTDMGELPTASAQSDLREANRRYFLAHLGADDFAAWLAEADGRVVGSSAVVLWERPPGAQNPSGKEGYILSVYIVPEWRGQGIGSRLTMAAADHARAAGAARIWLRTTEAGRPVYERLGFRARTDHLELG
jgi:ribosomal protein S18 acetylase RimI-like enzyme